MSAYTRLNPHSGQTKTCVANFSLTPIEYLVHYRGSSMMATANNTLIRSKGYTQRWMSETSYSTVKRTQDSALRSRFWYRQFREIVPLFALNNIKRLSKTL
ncbi:hypothetical protein GCM10008995_01710 [Halobellus salinus]|uniref:Transposase DDE domain-containing protein n=1 Tax=Halobellus salinus TaxID=931585 RepID=A0A830ENV0_9EURY|nr:hypothetical protein GCM10008995_01710 [Halobellus salinus]SMP11920.1 hypothetical protein SAMN06265347_10413 [Halobellus salinus]